MPGSRHLFGFMVLRKIIELYNTGVLPDELVNFSLLLLDKGRSSPFVGQRRVTARAVGEVACAFHSQMVARFNPWHL